MIRKLIRFFRCLSAHLNPSICEDDGYTLRNDLLAKAFLSKEVK